MEKTINNLESLDDLLVSEMQHLYSTKEEILRVWPSVLGAVNDREMRRVFITLQNEAVEQKERLENIGQKFNVDLDGFLSKSVMGMMEEIKDTLNSETTPEIMDDGFMAITQRLINHELSEYATVCHYAYLLGYEEAGNILQNTYSEQLEAREKTNKLATGKINERAL